MGKLGGEKESVNETNNIHLFAYIPWLSYQISEQ